MSFVNDQIKFKWQIMYYMNLFYNQRVQKKQTMRNGGSSSEMFRLERIPQLRLIYHFLHGYLLPNMPINSVHLCFFTPLATEATCVLILKI